MPPKKKSNKGNEESVISNSSTVTSVKDISVNELFDTMWQLILQGSKEFWKDSAVALNTKYNCALDGNSLRSKYNSASVKPKILTMARGAATRSETQLPKWWSDEIDKHTELQEKKLKKKAETNTEILQPRKKHKPSNLNDFVELQNSDEEYNDKESNDEDEHDLNINITERSNLQKEKNLFSLIDKLPLYQKITGIENEEKEKTIEQQEKPSIILEQARSSGRLSLSTRTEFNDNTSVLTANNIPFLLPIIVHNSNTNCGIILIPKKISGLKVGCAPNFVERKLEITIESDLIQEKRIRDIIGNGYILDSDVITVEQTTRLINTTLKFPIPETYVFDSNNIPTPIDILDENYFALKLEVKQQTNVVIKFF